MKVNLHTHSTVSDGTLSPKELILKLVSDEVQIIALTDHDRIDGLHEAYITAQELGIQFINGIELSVHIHDLDIDELEPEHHTLHMLGLNFNLELFNLLMKERLIRKEGRLKDLVKVLRNEGYSINADTYYARKTAIAQALVDAGYANDIQEAFNLIINKHYDRSIDFMNINEACELIHSAGGKLLWAHPFDILYDIKKVRIEKELVDKIASKLKIKKVDGIEVYYQPFNEDQIQFLKSIQEKYQFIASSGTDYHGKESRKVTYVDLDLKLISEVIK
jgi:predicted metal-dependent phosphoesterase TrpH